MEYLDEGVCKYSKFVKKTAWLCKIDITKNSAMCYKLHSHKTMVVKQILQRISRVLKKWLAINEIIPRFPINLATRKKSERGRIRIKGLAVKCFLGQEGTLWQGEVDRKDINIYLSQTATWKEDLRVFVEGESGTEFEVFVMRYDWTLWAFANQLDPLFSRKKDWVKWQKVIYVGYVDLR